jgi:hypothetical protein
MPGSTEIIAVMPSPSLADWVFLKGLQSKGVSASAVVLDVAAEHRGFCDEIPVYRPKEPVDWLEGEVIRLERLVSDGALVSM